MESEPRTPGKDRRNSSGQSNFARKILRWHGTTHALHPDEAVRSFLRL